MAKATAVQVGLAVQRQAAQAATAPSGQRPVSTPALLVLVVVVVAIKQELVVQV